MYLPVFVADLGLRLSLSGDQLPLGSGRIVAPARDAGRRGAASPSRPDWPPAEVLSPPV